MLDPTTVQVLFVDLQPLNIARSKTNPPDALAHPTAVLARVARLLHLPMHISIVPHGRQPAALIPELARETEGIMQYPRLSANPFADEATRVAIAAAGRQHLAIAGFPTEAVVLHAVRAALAAGYRAYVPLDACAACYPLRRTRRSGRSRRLVGSRRPSSRWSRQWCPISARTSAGRLSGFFTRSG